MCYEMTGFPKSSPTNELSKYLLLSLRTLWNLVGRHINIFKAELTYIYRVHLFFMYKAFKSTNMTSFSENIGNSRLIREQLFNLYNTHEGHGINSANGKYKEREWEMYSLVWFKCKTSAIKGNTFSLERKWSTEQKVNKQFIAESPISAWHYLWSPSLRRKYIRDEAW